MSQTGLRILVNLQNIMWLLHALQTTQIGSPEIWFMSDCISEMMNFLSEPSGFLSSQQLHI